MRKLKLVCSQKVARNESLSRDENFHNITQSEGGGNDNTAPNFSTKLSRSYYRVKLFCFVLRDI